MKKLKKILSILATSLLVLVFFSFVLADDMDEYSTESDILNVESDTLNAESDTQAEESDTLDEESDTQAEESNTTDEESNTADEESDPVEEEEENEKDVEAETEPNQEPRRTTPMLRNDLDDLVHREVTSWAQLLGAIADRTVDVIEITDDFAAPNSTGWHYIGNALPPGHGSTTGNGSGSARELIINGNGHTINFNDWAVCFNNNNITGAGARRNGWHITWNDLNSFGTNIWGFTTFNDLSTTNQQNSVMVYNNISYIGSQLTHSPAGQVIMRGEVTNRVVARHEPPNDPAHHRNLTALQSQQNNIHVQNLTLDENATVNLSVLHAGNIDLMSGGELRLESGSTLNVEGSPTTATPGNSSNMDEARGINIQIRAGGYLIVEDGATVNLLPKPTFSAISMLGTGSDVLIQEGGEIYINTNGLATANAQGETNNLVHMGAGATLEINGLMCIQSSNTTGDAHIMRIGSPAAGGTAGDANRTNLIVNGTLNIEARGMDTSTASLIHFGNPAHISPNANGGDLLVNEDGILNLVSDSDAANHHLIYFNAGLTVANASIFEFRDSEYINLQRVGIVPEGAGLIGMNGTVGNLRLDIQEVDLWEVGNLSESSDHHWLPLFAAIIQYSGANATTTGGIPNSRTTSILGGFGLTLADSSYFRQNFQTQNVQRITMGHITDVEVEITSESATDASRLLTGTGTPGAYLRITDDPPGIFGPSTTNNIPSPIENQPELFEVPDLISNPEEYILDFTLEIPENGEWEYHLPAATHFTADTTIRVFAFLNGKSAYDTLFVTDATPPEADPVSVFVYGGDPVPNPSDFVTNIRDTNPAPQDFRIEFSSRNPLAMIEDLMKITGTTPIYIYIFDNAGNRAEIRSELSVTHFVDLEFTKMDQLLYTDFEQSEPLGNVVFNLYIWEYVDDDYDWLLLHEGVESDEDGFVKFENLIAGNLFKLVETFAPEGFQLPDGHWYIEIAADQTITITRSLDEDENQHEDVAFILRDGEWFVGNLNIKVTPFNFFKMDELMYSEFENAAFLEGAAFEIYSYEDEDWVLVHTETSDEDGFVEFILVNDATYRLVEVSAPDGYQIPRGHWIIEIDEDGEITITAEGTLVPAFRANNDLCYLGNIREFELPILGGLGVNQTLLTIGLMIMLCAVSLYLFIKRRRISPKS